MHPRAAFVLVLLATSTAWSERPARELAVAVPLSSSCPEGKALIDTLEGELPHWSVAPLAHRAPGLVVRVKPVRKGRLLLELVDRGNVVQQRPLDFAPSNCRDLAGTIALIVKVWVHALPEVAMPPPERATRAALAATLPLKSPPPREALPRAPPPAAVVESASAPPPPAPEPIAPPPVPTLTPPLEPAAPPSVPATLDAPLPGDAGPATSPDTDGGPVIAPLLPAIHLEVEAGGGGLVSTMGTLAPTAALRLDLGFGATWGIEAWGGWDGDLSASAPKGIGTIQIARQALGLELRATLHPLASTSSRVMLLAGPALERLDGSATGFSSHRSEIGLGEGIEVGAFWAQTLAGGLSLWAGPTGRWWFSQDSFRVANLGAPNGAPTLSTTPPRFWVGASLGVAYRWF